MRKPAAMLLLLAIMLVAACSSKPKTDLEAGIQAYERKDYVTAQREILPWAEYGDPRAQLYLARTVIMLPHPSTSEGVRKVDAEMVKWLRKAAEKDYEPAQFELARMQYLVPMHVSEAEAMKWWRKSADHGNPNAITVLADWYMRPPRSNQTISYALYKLAAKIVADSGETELRIRPGESLDKLSARMSPEQIEAGEALARRLDAPDAVLSKEIEKP